MEMNGIRRIFSDFYAKKRVLVTGHTGFKGAWLSIWLESLGADVVGYSLDPPTEPSLFAGAGLSSRVTDIRGDICDLPHLTHVLERFRPDFIFHLAAQPIVRYSYRQPLDTFRVNVLGTANLLEAVRISRIPSVLVCVTSDKCYENREWEYAYRETDALGGHDPYSASKGAAEIVISSYRRSFFGNNDTGRVPCAVSSVRAGNIIGGGDWAPDRLVPDCIRSLSRGDPVRIRSPGAVRPWQHVLDPLCGYLLLGIRMSGDPSRYSDAWNFGPGYGNSVSVGELASQVVREWGDGSWEDASDPEAVHEASVLRLDITKATTRLGWSPRYDLPGAVRRTVSWFRAFCREAADPYLLTRDQITEFMDNAEMGSHRDT